MGGSGLNCAWVGAGIQDHILRKVTGLGRRPSCPPNHSSPGDLCFQKQGQGSALLCPVRLAVASWASVQGECCWLHPWQWSSWPWHLKTRSLVLCIVQEHLGEGGSSAQTFSPRPHKSSEGFPLWVYKSPLSNSWLKRIELAGKRLFKSHFE